MKMIFNSSTLRIIATCLITVIIFSVSAAEHKIIVLSDPHVMVEELLVRDGKAFQRYQSQMRRMCDYSKAIFDQAILEIVSMCPKPELVLIVGDISKDGELVNHKYVKRKLDELRAAGISTLVIPGNHDWGKRPNAVYYDGERTITATKCVRFGLGDNSLEKIYADYGFRTCYKDSATFSVPVERESVSKTLTYACEPIDGLVVIGIDTGKNEVISEHSLEWICSKAQTAFSENKQVIAMMHHPLLPHQTGGGHVIYPSIKKDSKSERKGYEIVRNRLSDIGIDVIFTGHIHYQDITKDWNSDLTHEIYDVTTGSLCCYPCYYRILKFNDGLDTLSISSSRIIEAGNSIKGKIFSPKVAKSRFTTDKMVKMIVKKMIAAGISEHDALIAAPYFAKLYIYHSEGDEHKNNDAQKLLLTLNNLLAKYPMYINKANSILRDLSNYGVVDRENQTDDNTLIIKM